MKENKQRKSRLAPWADEPFGVLREDPFRSLRWAFSMPRFFRMPAIREEFFNMPSMPNTDIIDNGDSFTVKIDMPGVEKKDIRLKVTDTALQVEANKSSESETSRKNYYSRERSAYGYQRIVRFPEEVESKTSRAKLANGILQVDVRKAHPSSTSEVRIE